MIDGNFKLIIGVLLIIFFVLISFYTDYIYAMLFQTGTEIYLITPSINKELFSGELGSENVFFKATNDVRVNYEVVGEIKDWIKINGSENIEKEKISRITLLIETPKNITTGVYSGKILIHYQNNIKEIQVLLNLTNFEPIKIQYGEKHAPFEIDAKINGTEFYGNLFDYMNHSTCLGINLPEGSERVHVELSMEKDDDIDACIYSGDLDTPYMCSIRPRGRNESLTVISVQNPLVVCIYPSKGENNSLIGDTANFSGYITFGVSELENITNLTSKTLSGKILYLYTINCKTCRDFAPKLLDFISDKNITLKLWTDDGLSQPAFNNSLEAHIVGYYTPKDLSAVEKVGISLISEGCPDYLTNYLNNNLPSSYTCVCTSKGLCDSFENEGDINQRMMEVNSHFTDLMGGMA